MTKKEIKEALDGINKSERITFLNEWLENIVNNDTFSKKDLPTINNIQEIIKELREEDSDEYI